LNHLKKIYEQGDNLLGMAKKKVKIIKLVDPYIPKNEKKIYIYFGEKRYRRLQPVPWAYNKPNYEYLKSK